MKYVAAILLLSCLSFQPFAQGISYTAQGRATALGFETDYHALGINSSALGWGTGYEDFKFTTGAMEFYGYMRSDSLSKDNFSNMYNLMRGQIDKKEFNREETQQLGAGALKLAQAGVEGQIDMSFLNFSFQGPKFGGLAINIMDSYRMDTRVNTDNAKLIFQGDWSDVLDSVSIDFDGDTSKVKYRNDLGSDTLQNIFALHLDSPLDFNQMTAGTRFTMAWNRYYNIGYGRKILQKDSLFILYGGIGARFIQSIAYIDFASNGTSSYLHTSLPDRARSSKGSVAQINPLNFGSVGGAFPEPVGYGYGLDFSASALLFKKFRVAAAVNNIGSVKYRQKVYQGTSGGEQTLYVDGLDPTDFEEDIRELIQGTQLVEFVEERTFEVPNASTFRLGGSFQPIKQVQVGLEVIGPFTDKNSLNLQNTIFAAGLELRPVRWVAITTGYWGGGVYDGQIPLGLNFIFKGGAYEMGVASRDLFQFIDNGSNTISGALGFARVRF